MKLKCRLLCKAVSGMSSFWQIKVVQVICVPAVLVLTFSPPPLGLRDPASGYVIDAGNATNTREGFILVDGLQRPLVASTKLQMVCLTFSRMSGFALYPVLILVFLSKCKALCNFVESTLFSMFFYKDTHKLHVYCGQFIAIDVWLHALAHIIRWVDSGNVSLLLRTRTGVSGLVALSALPLMTLPMMFCRQTMSYEARKFLHYLFYPFALALCLHVPASAVPQGGYIAWILGASIGLYTLDALYISIVMTEKIETTLFHVLPSGVQMTFEASQKFQNRSKNGGYIYVCLPWIDKTQWHAFSLYEMASNPTKRQVFMMIAGDWTADVHTSLQRNTVRPVWVQGPFTSPYSTAIMYDNQILVASGIGVTPALSVIRAQKGARRVNLIWAVRDAAMLEFFIERNQLDDESWSLIFYTGDSPLTLSTGELPENIRVIRGRPDLNSVVPNIIYSIETGYGLPQEGWQEKQLRRELATLAIQMETSANTSPGEQLAQLRKMARERGYSLAEFCRAPQQHSSDRGRRPGQKGHSDRGVKPVLSRSSSLVSDTVIEPVRRMVRKSVSFNRTHAFDATAESDLLERNAAAPVLGMKSDLVEAKLAALEAESTFFQGGGKRLSKLSEAEENCEDTGLGTKMRRMETRFALDGIKTLAGAKYEAALRGKHPSAGTTPHCCSPEPEEGPEPGEAASAAARPGDPQGVVEPDDFRINVPESAEAYSDGTASTAPRIRWQNSTDKRIAIHQPMPAAEEFVLGLEPQILASWAILYCGGSKPVEQELAAVSRTYKIEMMSESFAW